MGGGVVSGQCRSGRRKQNAAECQYVTGNLKSLGPKALSRMLTATSECQYQENHIKQMQPMFDPRITSRARPVELHLSIWAAQLFVQAGWQVSELDDRGCLPD